MTSDPKTSENCVFVVDDDRAMRDSVAFLLGSAGLRSECFCSGPDLLALDLENRRGCVLTDVRMPGMSGLELQKALSRRGLDLPVIVMTAFADVPVAVRAMREGAFDFVEKPFHDRELIDRVLAAITEDRDRSRDRDRRLAIAERHRQLSDRECEVCELVVDGLLNKQIAGRLGISIKTVETHRSRVMEKMEADSLADLVRQIVVLEEGDR